jgi:hypothetical protein
MSKQYNKGQKRQRREAYIKRKKSAPKTKAPAKAAPAAAPAA